MLPFPVNGPLPRVGDRVIVRRRLADTPGHLSDVIGHVEQLSPLRIRPQLVGGLPSSAAAIEIEPQLVKVLKVLSPRRVLNSDIRAIETATARAFPGVEHSWTSDGQWLMRAGDGITERSNSATPLGRTAGFGAVPLAEFESFYARHGLPLRVHLPERIARNAERMCQDANWKHGPEISVMARHISQEPEPSMPAAPPVSGALCASPLPELELPAGYAVCVDTQPDEEWLGMYHFRGHALPYRALRLLMDDIDGELGFARLVHEEKTVAITRATITSSDDDRRWLGFSAVEVSPAYRRRGLGTQLGRAVLQWGAQRGADHAYLQVISSNEAGIGLYTRLGFIEHHRHHYAERGRA